jgi:hypothetical protein
MKMKYLAALAAVLLSSTTALATVACDSAGNCVITPTYPPIAPAPPPPPPPPPIPPPAAAQSYASPPPDCDQLGSIVGLNPNGDNNLSVHATSHPRDTRDEIDELFTGDSVCVIGQDGLWDHVQYIRDGRSHIGWSSSSYIKLAEARTPPKTGAISMTCPGFTMIFTDKGRLFSLKENMEETDYIVTKVENNPDGLTVRGLTKFGRVAAFYSVALNARPRVFWTSSKGSVVQDCDTVE